MKGTRPTHQSSGYTRYWIAAALVAVGVVGGTAAAQFAPVDDLGVITAKQALHALGFNIPDPTQRWEFAAAKAAGAAHVRIQCGWDTAEVQRPDNSSGGFVLSPACAQGLRNAKEYGLEVTVLAAYGPPFHDRFYVTVPGGASPGATSFRVHLRSANFGDTDLRRLRAGVDYFYGAGNQIASVHAPAGDLISQVVPLGLRDATITLASALTTKLDSETVFYIRERLYPPPSSFNPQDASTGRYVAYARFLAESISQRGLKGQVEIWNEPPWGDDPWDVAQDFFDHFEPSKDGYGPRTGGLPNFGFAVALEALGQPPHGVSYVWGGTEKSGSNTLADPVLMKDQTGTSSLRPRVAVRAESYHPYGAWPEMVLWNAPCLRNHPADQIYTCALNRQGPSGQYNAGNFLQAAKASLEADREVRGAGLVQEITETGLGAKATDAAHQTRFVLRQLLGYEAAGIAEIDWYALYETSPDDFSFFNSDHTARPQLVALQAYMQDVASLGAMPPSGGEPSLGVVTAYQGTDFPLAVTHTVGRSNASGRDTDLIVLWQESGSRHPATWVKDVSPPGASATVVLAAGVAVRRVLDLSTREPVPYSLKGQGLTLQVSDSPVEISVQRLR